MIKNNILFLKIISFGLTRKQTEKVIKQYDKDYIEEILGVVEKEFKAGKIDNIAAYTLSALREDYRPKRALPKEKHKIKRECRETSRELLERLQRDFDAYRLQTALGNLSEQERKDLETQFVEKLDRGEGGDAIIRKFYNNHGFEHKAVISMFRYFARQRLLSEPKKAEFHDFVKQRGYDLDELQPVLSSPPQLAIPS